MVVWFGSQFNLKDLDHLDFLLVRKINRVQLVKHSTLLLHIDTVCTMP